MIIRVYADESGETHLSALQLPESHTDGVGLAHRGIDSIPTTTLGITDMLQRRRSWEPHPAPRRQLVIVTRGAFEIVTSDGKRHRFGPGDVLFADDLDSKGHTFTDVGDEPLFAYYIGIEGDWQWPH